MYKSVSGQSCVNYPMMGSSDCSSDSNIEEISSFPYNDNKFRKRNRILFMMDAVQFSCAHSKGTVDHETSYITNSSELNTSSSILQDPIKLYSMELKWMLLIFIATLVVVTCGLPVFRPKGKINFSMNEINRSY